MSFSSDLAGLKSIAERAEKIGEEGFTKAETVLGDPEAAELLHVVFQLVGINPIPGTIAGLTGMAKSLVALFPPTPPAAVPA